MSDDEKTRCLGIPLEIVGWGVGKKRLMIDEWRNIIPKMNEMK